MQGDIRKALENMRGSGSEMTDILERAFMARIRAMSTGRRSLPYSRSSTSGGCHRDQAPDRALRGGAPAVHREGAGAGRHQAGSFRLKVRTRKQRTVIPERFFARFARRRSSVLHCRHRQAEALLGKGRLMTAVRSRSRISVRRLSMCARGVGVIPHSPAARSPTATPGRSVLRRGI